MELSSKPESKGNGNLNEIIFTSVGNQGELECIVEFESKILFTKEKILITKSKITGENIKDMITINKNEIISMGTIGEGQWKVEKVQLPINGSDKYQTYAIKYISNVLDDPQNYNTLIKEIKILGKVKSKYILKCYSGFYNKDSHSVGLVLEYMDLGNLNRLIKIRENTEKPFPELLIAYIIKKILKGLYYLHSHHCIHRDIKPANILINSHGNIKIADFGLSKFSQSSLSKDSQSNTGSWLYTSPERIEGNKHISYNTDIWSLGLILFQLVTGSIPYKPENCFDQIVNNNAPRLFPSKTNSESLCSITNLMLEKDSSKRPNSSTLYLHEFFHLIKDISPLVMKKTLVQILKESSNN